MEAAAHSLVSRRNFAALGASVLEELEGHWKASHLFLLAHRPRCAAIPARVLLEHVVQRGTGRSVLHGPCIGQNWWFRQGWKR